MARASPSVSKRRITGENRRPQLREQGKPPSALGFTGLCIVIGFHYPMLGLVISLLLHLRCPFIALFLSVF
jgi:hypothetical protein